MSFNDAISNSDLTTEEFETTFKSLKRQPEYLMSFNDAISNSDLTTEEFETTFKSLKRNKAAGIDTINSNAVLDTYDEIKDILFLIFKSSLQQGT